MNLKPSRRSASAQDIEVLLREGRQLHAQGRLNEAFARYQAAVAADPQHADAQHLLGLGYVALGHMDAGLAFIRRAIAQSPNSIDFRANLATALVQLGRHGEAEQELQNACAMTPGDVELRIALAVQQARMLRFDAAIASYARAAELAPQRADVHESLARLRYQADDLAAAVSSAQQAVALAPARAARLNMGHAAAQGQPAPRADISVLNASTALSADDLRQACRDRDLLVIDDFLTDPMSVRAEAIALHGQRSRELPHSNFPGAQSLAQPCQPLMQRMADAIGRSIKWDSLDNGALRVSLAADKARADVHLDSPLLQDIYGAVLYLSLPEHSQGGTSFFRHRASGWDRRPTDAQLQTGGYRSLLDFQQRGLPAPRSLPFTEWQQQRETTWDWMFEVPMRFNRLIIYRSNFFHAISNLFGDHADNGRLVQLFHFETIAPR